MNSINLVAGEKILVCDDDELMRSIIHISLAQIGGFIVKTAASGAEALALFDEEGADLVVLDVNMPDMDGRATLRNLRSRPSGAIVPVIFLSATDDSAEIQQLRGMGAAEVVSKPFNMIQFPETVRRLLMIRHAATRRDPG